MDLESEACWGVIQVFIELGLKTLVGLGTGVTKTVPHLSSLLGIFEGV